LRLLLLLQLMLVARFEGGAADSQSSGRPPL